MDSNNINISILNHYGFGYFMDMDKVFPRMLGGRSLSKFYYFKEGDISDKLKTRIKHKFYGVAIESKKNADIYLTIHAVQIAPKIDTIIIASGDGDYIPLVEHLKANGVRVEICCVEATASKQLLDMADACHYITKDDCFNQAKLVNHTIITR